MNAPPPFNDFRSGSPSELSDERMDQIRELLMGDAMRHLEARLSHLEARLQGIEVNLVRKLDVLETRLEALNGAADGDRRTSFEALSQAVVELGEQIRRISRG